MKFKMESKFLVVIAWIRISIMKLIVGREDIYLNEISIGLEQIRFRNCSKLIVASLRIKFPFW